MSGLSLSKLPSFVRRSAAVITGYSQAMSSGVGAHTDYIYAVIVIVIVGLAVFLGSAGRDRLQRGGISLVTLVLAFFAFKEGFVRHEVGHTVQFFAMCCLLVAAIRTGTNGTRLAVALSVTVACTIVVSGPLALSTDATHGWGI